MPIVQYTISGLYEGLTLSELIARAQDRLKQKRGNFDRYAKDVIVSALNETAIEVAQRLRCLHSFAIIELRADYSQYKLPSQMLLPERFFFYESATSYWELEQRTRDWMDKNVPGWRTVTGDPTHAFPGDNYGTMRKLGFYPIPDTTGTSYTTATADTGVYVAESGMTTTGNVTGQNSAASATVCTDADGRTLSALGVQIGMVAVNVNTGESGQMSAVTGSTFTVSAADFPTGWAVADNFTILAGEYGVITSWENDEQYLFTSDIGGMATIQSIVNNVYLEFVRRPLPLQFDTQYPEIPVEVQPYMPDNAAWILKRNRPRESTDFQEAMAAREAFLYGLSLYKPLEDVMDHGTTMRYNL